jgi:hypothetical protein
MSLALGEGNVVQIEVTAARPKSLDGAAEIVGPYSAEPLGENLRIDRLNPRSVRLEIAQPALGGALVMPTQVLNVDDM